jgi:tRNA1(Val) A37 N6-methylase TrmN6
MARKYDVVVTNPPYMGGSGMSKKLGEFVKKHYPDSKSDLFAIFIERCSNMLKKHGYQAMITQHSWMFLSSFEKLRLHIINNYTFIFLRSFFRFRTLITAATRACLP